MPAALAAKPSVVRTPYSSETQPVLLTFAGDSSATSTPRLGPFALKSLKRETAALNRRYTWALRNGSKDAVHEARVQARRLRVLFEILAPWSGTAGAQAVRHVAWASHIFGPTRSFDVALESLTAQNRRLQVSDQASLRQILTLLRRSRNAAWARARQAWASERGNEFRASLRRYRSAEGWTATFGDHLPLADVRDAWLEKAHKQARTRIHDLEDRPGAIRLHRTRIAIKRFRHGWQLLDGFSLADPPRGFRRLVKLQGALGDVHDYLDLRNHLRRIGRQRSSTMSPAVAFLAGQLASDLEREAQALTRDAVRKLRTLAKKGFRSRFERANGSVPKGAA